MANTPRLDLRRPAGGDTFNVAGDIEQIVDILDNAALWQTTTLAGRPAANSVPTGTVHHATDTGDVSICIGTSWFTVTPGNRCAFSARGGTQTIATGSPVKKTLLTQNFDHGDTFDPANSKFVAPVKGIYEFSLSLIAQFSGSSTEFATVALYVNGVAWPYQLGTIVDDSATWTTFFAAALLELNAGDYVEVFITPTTTGSRDFNVQRFDGKLIAQLP